MITFIIVGFQALETIIVLGKEPFERADGIVVMVMIHQTENLISTGGVDDHNRKSKGFEPSCKAFQFGRTTHRSKRNTHILLETLHFPLERDPSSHAEAIVGVKGSLVSCP